MAKKISKKRKKLKKRASSARPPMRRKKIQKKVLTKRKISYLESKKIRIQVLGIGGGGGSIISEIAPKLKKIKFLAANTDLQALKKITKEAKRFQFGQNLTRGLGTGMNPQLGEKAAQVEIEKIKKIFQGQDFSILISCLGGGTGSGASSIFAKAARDFKNYTLGIFTLPFLFEGQKRLEIAQKALEKLKPDLNAIIIVPNERVFRIIDQKTPIKRAFSAINKILAENLEGLIEMLYSPGLINIDFADMKTILAGRGKLAYFNTIICQGENRAETAAKMVLENPLSEYGISGAERILFNISGSKDLRMAEVEKISKTISDFNKRAKIIFGISQNEKYKGSLKITLLAIGIKEKPKVISEKRKKKKKVRPKKIICQKEIIKAAPKPSKRIKKVKIRRKKRTIKKTKVKKAKPEKLPSEIEKGESSFAPAPAPATAGKKASALPSEALNDSEERRREGKEEKIEIKIRRNALDLKKEAERAEQELLAKESQWEIPAFLRRRAKK